MQPPPRRLAAAGWYAAAVSLTCALYGWGQRLDRADFHAPFGYHGDSLLILPMVKATLERGSHWRNERLGAPGVQELHDFPVVDHLHFALIWLLGRFDPDPVFVFNLYHALTYPLTTLCGMAALRRLGLSVPAAGAAATLYTFLPYHYIRGLGHYFLAAYWVVPLTLLVTLAIAGGRPVFAGRRWVGTLLIAAATSAAGAYYAFFGCALLAVAGVYAAVAARTWRPLAVAGAVVGIVVLGGVVQHLPAVVYQAEFGHNSQPHVRASEEAEQYGLKLTHLVLPIADHRSRWLARIQTSYDSADRPAQTDNRTATLGLVGTAGLIGLLAACVFPMRKPDLIGPTAALTLAAVLIGTIGGVGAVAAHLVSPQVRAYNRISISIAFLCLFAAFWAVDRLAARTRRPTLARWVVCAGLTAFGIWDQTPRTWFRRAAADHALHVADEYRADAAFFGPLDAVMPGGMVFMLPVVPYPETLRVENLSGYDHARGYLHTSTIHWSFGAMRGREADQWQREVGTLPAAAMLDRLAVYGFAGLFIDRRGYTPAAADALISAVTQEAGPPLGTHPDGQQLLFDLRPFTERRRAELGAGFDRLAATDREAVRVLWLDGFQSFEPLGREHLHRWSAATSQAVVVNPTGRPRTFDLSMVFRTTSDVPTTLRVRGGVWDAHYTVTRTAGKVSARVTVPPGRHPVTFACDVPPDWRPDHSRRHLFFVAEFAMAEVGG